METNERIRYRFYRDSDKVPRVVLCRIEKNDVKATGIALCSFDETPNKRVGKAIAWGRAQKALKCNGNASTPMCSDRAYEILRACGLQVLFTCYKGFVIAQSQQSAALA